MVLTLPTEMNIPRPSIKGILGGSNHGDHCSAEFSRPSVEFRRASHHPSKEDDDTSTTLGDSSLSHHGRPSCHGMEDLKGDIIAPSSTLKQTITVKMGQFCTEKLVQGRKRLHKLYGRQVEIDTLTRELNRVCGGGGGGRSLVLIEGLSGEGKTALALELKKPALDQHKAFFVSGKFDLDQVTAGEPYAGIKEALRQLVQQMEGCQEIKTSIRSTLTWEIDILCKFMPELAIFLKGRRQAFGEQYGGKQDSNQGMSIQNLTERFRNLRSSKRDGAGSLRSSTAFRPRGELRNSSIVARPEEDGTDYSPETSNARSATDRLCFALRKLVNVVSAFRPLVLLADDVQWSDPASIALLQGWITDDGNPALMLIWTYRSNLVNQDHVVSKAIESIRVVANDRSIVVTPIKVANLTEMDVREFVSDMLDIQQGEQRVAELTFLLYKKTLGNVFFCIQYLLSLAQKGLLTFNMGTSQWSWDLQAVREGLTATETVVDLMKEKLERSPAAKMILPLAACIGTTFDVWVLQELLQGIQAVEDRAAKHLFQDVLGVQQSAAAFSQEQLVAIESDGLIEAIGASSYAFIHDKVIEGAMSMVQDEKRDILKFYMGSILFGRLNELEAQRADQVMYLIVNLLNARLDMIPEDQRMAVCEINIAAGDEAYLSAAYRRSAFYYGAAIALLPPNHWETHYSESLRLYTFAAEAEMCLGNYDQMKEYTHVVFSLEGLPLLDTLPIHKVHLDALGANVELMEAWTKCQKVLKSAGCKVPDKRVSWRTKMAIQKVKWNRKAYMPEALSKLPIIDDPLDEEVAKLQDHLILISVYCNPGAAPLCIMLAYKRILKRGISRYSAPVLAWFGFLICAVFGDLQWSREHMEFVNTLVDRFKTKAVESRVAMVFSIFCAHWATPIQEAPKRYIKGYSRGMETCDMDSAFWCAHFYHEAALHSGTNLDLLSKDTDVYGKQMLDYGMMKHLHCHQSIWQLILNLRGLSDNTTILTGTAQDEEAAIQVTRENGDLHHLAHIQKDRLFAMAFFGDWEKAATLGVENIDLICAVLAAQHATVVSRFLTGVACFEMLHRNPTKAQKKKYLAAAKVCLAQMKGWFAKGDPNTQHYMLFLQAEEAAYKGQIQTAVSLFDRALRLAARTGYNHDQALACERLSALYSRWDDQASAKQYLQDAVVLYREWGAAKKVELMEEQLRTFAV